MPEIIPLEQDRLAHRLCERIGGTVTEIQRRRVSTSLAEIPIRLASNPRLGLCNRLDAQPCFAKEIVKPPARNRIPTPINYGGCFHIIDCRYAAVFRAG